MTTKARKPKKVEALAKQTAPTDVGDGGPRFVFLPQRTSGVRVTEESAMTLGAVWACVRVIAESLASLPSPVMRKRPDGGRDVQYLNPIHWLLNTESNPETPAFQWKETLIAHALTWGNGYSEIEKDQAGRVVWSWQITPDRVEVVRYKGRILYDVANPREANTVLEADEMFHLRGLGFDGLVGYPVIRMASRAIGLGMAAEEAGSGFFGNDSTPGGILKHPGKLSDQARENIEKGWQKKHGGPGNRRTVAILEENMDWVATGLPPEDAQLVQQMQLTPSSICRWFRVPPHKIADLSRSTNNNIEHQSIEFVTDCLLPWARRLESEADVKFFGRTQRGTLFTRVNFNGLLRGDVSARGQFYKDMVDRAVFSVNDVLELEDRNPIGPDGDKRFVPLNMTTLEKAGEEPPPGAMAPPAEEPPPEKAKMARLEVAGVEVLRDAVRRVLGREAANKHLAGDERTAWAVKQRAYSINAISPPARVLAELYASDAETATRVAVNLFLDSHAVEPLSDADAATAKLHKYITAASAAA